MLTSSSQLHSGKEAPLDEDSTELSCNCTLRSSSRPCSSSNAAQHHGSQVNSKAMPLHQPQLLIFQHELLTASISSPSAFTA